MDRVDVVVVIDAILEKTKGLTEEGDTDAVKRVPNPQVRL